MEVIRKEILPGIFVLECRGALLIGVLTNGLVIMHVSSYWQQVVIGLIIVAAVAFDTYAKSHR